MVIFSALALGFYAATTTASQVASNEKTSLSAQMAAESGIQFIRYHLSSLHIPPGLQGSQLFDEVYTQLSNRLDHTANLNGGLVGYDPTTISIPATDYVNLDAAGTQRFRITMTLAGDIIVTKIIGRGGNISVGRGVEVKYQKARNSSAIFNYGVAARGSVSMNGNVKIEGAGDPTKGSLLAATDSGVPLTATGGVSISGDFSYTNATGAPNFSPSMSIAGIPYGNPNFMQHVHAGIDPPEFPSIDTTVYVPFATNTYSGGNTLVNCVIPANTNPTFTGNTLIQGVLYVKTPNKITFGGNTTIQGCIVVENNPLGSSNSITFSGNVSASGIDTLPPSTQFPAAERALTGAFLLAPRFAVSFSGDFGTIGGSMVADRFTFSGNAGGTVRGSVIALTDVPLSMSGTSDIIIASVGTTEYPPGVTFSSYYTTVPGSYLEVPVN